uniref:Uncharacterized protein n=1 Tax=Ganoderma boninense TaxID=34458 RepID=A0A5K1JXT9_9APHY|nr:Uncharacterized protein [Ganoderma boninense]
MSGSIFPPVVHGPALSHDPPNQLYDNWNGMLAHNRPPMDDNEDLPVDEQHLQDVLMHPLSAADIAALEAEGPWQMENAGLGARDVQGILEEGPHYVNAHLGEKNYWPWEDKARCTMSALHAFPRALFSESEIEDVRWFAHANGVPKLPSVKMVEREREDITKIAGAAPQMCTSKMGKVYAMATLAVMLTHATQEFANPIMMAYLQTLPELGSASFGECAQGERWASEVDPNLAGPMVRAPDGRDYFVNELAMVSEGTGPACFPVVIRRWFRKGGGTCASVCPVLTYDDKPGLVVDDREGSRFEVPLAAMRYCVEDLLKPPWYAPDYLPSPSIIGTLVDDEKPVSPWEFPIRNEWRDKAGGMRVVGCPIWLYCDDTSGNTSKKWNKHNSLLFTLAGLPRSMAQLMYNIHYLATSNIAAPLEMMESLVEQLCEVRSKGIAVWDVQAKEHVLVVPWVLAFLGDNPMSSEFASHIGMQGKCFCRRCKVKGSDAKNRAEGEEGERERLRDFLNVRSKEDTLYWLNAQLTRALAGAPSGVDDIATDTGVKDKYFTHYVGKLQDAVNEVRERQKTSPPVGTSKADEVRQTLREVQEAMPRDLFNPALQIPDFDPSSDTPFEALHVVLLGAVKYFWRDAVSRLDSTAKDVLIAHLNSVITDGLGLPNIRGETLVQYAGWLVALCRLAPMIFQPVIHDFSVYERLKDGIKDFLAATALWSTQWFNKPKFHLFLHLPFYVRRFGPALLYATEGFESFNFLIRLRSVHSNRQAPSTDIAEAFSLLHAVRHLVSGGYVPVNTETADGPIEWWQAGDGVLALLANPIFQHMMGMDGVIDTGEVGFLQHSQLSPTVLRCTGLYLPNDNLVRPGGWVLYASTASSQTLCGRVDEILLRERNGAPFGVLVCKAQVSQTPTMPYRFPSVTPREGDYEFISIQDVLGTVHVFHNCAMHLCHPERTRLLMQERQNTAMLALEIKHIENTDLILNLAQLHNADMISTFRPADRYLGLSREEVVVRAVAHRSQLVAEAAQKKVDAAEKKAQAAQKKAQAAQKKKAREERKAQKEAAATVPQVRGIHPGSEVEEVGGERRVSEAGEHMPRLPSVHPPTATEGEYSSCK